MAAVSPSSGPVAGSSQLASPLSSPHHSLRTLPTSPAKPQDREQQQPRPKKRRQQQQRRESPSVASTESRQHTQPLPIKQSKQEENEEGPDGPPRRPPLLSLSSKSKPIVGPDGQAYTPGEAARLGLTIRTACEACRSRKLKCSGNPPDKGGCERCRTDNVDCIYTARAPIGRPKKRKQELEQSPENDYSSASGGPVTRRSSASGEPTPPSDSHWPTRSGTSPLGPHGPTSSQAKKSRVQLKSEEPSSVTNIQTQTNALELGSSSAYPQHVQSGRLWGVSADPSASSEAMYPASGPPPLFHSSNSPASSDPALHVQRSRSHSQVLTHASFHSPSDAYHAHHLQSAVGRGFHQRQASVSSTTASIALTPPSSTFGHLHQLQPPSAFSSPLTSHAGHSIDSSSPASVDLAAQQAASHYAQAQTRDAAPPTPVPGNYEALSNALGGTGNAASLDDLSLAVFLESLDTLEIQPSELMQQHHLQGSASYLGDRGQSYSSSPRFAANRATSMAASSSRQSAAGDQPSSSTIATRNAPQDFSSAFEQWSSSSAILQDGLSFAVPADFSWWDLQLGNEPGSSAGTSATPVATPVAPSGKASGAGEQRMPNLQRSLTYPVERSSESSMDSAGPRAAGRRQQFTESPTALHPPQTLGAEASPRIDSSANWPRGAENGMGQGHIHSIDQPGSTGFGWASLPRNSKRSATHQGGSPPDIATKASYVGESASGDSSCCSKKNTDQGTPQKVDDGGAQESAPASCCRSKSASSHAGDTDETESEQKPSCCSKGAESKVVEAKDQAGPSHSRVSPTLSKVHCVPNPSGKGCTCLCDMSVALLSVKRTLRETSRVGSGLEVEGGQSVATGPGSGRTTGAAAAAAATTQTIQLTLSASQAIAAQCACSADCPTCRSDPSTEVSASLLVSTALQIYARAVRTLRDGLTAGSGSLGGGLDVRIGEYRPAAWNSRKIALFAMKLELRDLSRALGKISRMANQTRALEARDGEGQGAEEKAASPTWMNPIDQLVIKKLNQQLGELLSTIESLEAQAQAQGPTHSHSHSHSHGHGQGGHSHHTNRAEDRGRGDGNEQRMGS